MNSMANIEISKGLNLHLIKTGKFKTNLFSIYINIPYSKSTATMAALLPMVLRRGTEKYPSLSAVAKRCEELYGATLYSGLRKKGDNAFLYFSLEFISDRYITEKIQKSAVEFLKEIVCFPKTENGVFDKNIVESEKVNLKDEIQGIINDKKEYADQRIKEISFPDSPYGIPHFGYEEDVSEINENNLYEFYKKILSECSVDIFFSGIFDEGEIKELIKDEFISIFSPVCAEVKETKAADAQNFEEVNRATEKMNVVQSKLCMMFYTSCPPFAEDYYAMTVFNCIFGGSPFSKLFNNVREKLSLAYYVSSRFDKQKGVIQISSGIESEKFDAAYDEIMLWLKKMQKGEFTDSEIISAKNYLETNLNSIKDNLRLYEDFFLSYISEGKAAQSIDDLINKIKAVSYDEIISAAQKLKLNSVYLLTN